MLEGSFKAQGTGMPGKLLLTCRGHQRVLLRHRNGQLKYAALVGRVPRALQAREGRSDCDYAFALLCFLAARGGQLLQAP